MGRLEGRPVIITGAASGIGRAGALLFAREGAKVIAADRVAEVENTAEEGKAAGGTIVAVQCDASDEADVQALVERSVKDHGGLAAIWANAGIGAAVGGGGPIETLTPEGWMTVLKVNLIGPFLAIKHATPVMRAAGTGSIIATASVAGIRSGAGGLPYSASKAGVINLVQTSANALYASGIRVNAICPGLIETGMTRGVYVMARQRGTEEKIGQLNPLKRGGEPHEIANTALFLASDDSSYVNGQAIVVDGGLSSSHPVGSRRG